MVIKKKTTTQKKKARVLHLAENINQRKSNSWWMLFIDTGNACVTSCFFTPFSEDSE